MVAFPIVPHEQSQSLSKLLPENEHPRNCREIQARSTGMAVKMKYPLDLDGQTIKDAKDDD
jgi:hypothetical protein